MDSAFKVNLNGYPVKYYYGIENIKILSLSLMKQRSKEMNETNNVKDK